MVDRKGARGSLLVREDRRETERENGSHGTRRRVEREENGVDEVNDLYTLVLREAIRVVR